MSTLRQTDLRHSMLRAIAEGRVCRGLDVSGWDIRGKLPTKRGVAENTVSTLVHAGLAMLPAGWRHDTPLVLTEDGRALLIRWGCSTEDVDRWTAQTGGAR